MNVKRTFSIKYPFEESERNSFLRMTTTSNEKIVSSFLFYMSLAPNELLYKRYEPLNLMEFLFEPIDENTSSMIEARVKSIIDETFPDINLKEVKLISDKQNLLIGVNVFLNVFNESFDVNLIF